MSAAFKVRVCVHCSSPATDSDGAISGGPYCHRCAPERRAEAARVFGLKKLGAYDLVGRYLLPGKAAQDRRGSTAVEFALIAPVLLLFLGGVVDFGRAFYYQTELNQALRSGMQYALKAPTDPQGIAAVISASTSIPVTVLAPATFCQCYDGTNVSCAGTCATPEGMRTYTKLEASFVWTPLFGNMGGLVPGSPLDAILFVRTQ